MTAKLQVENSSSLRNQRNEDVPEGVVRGEEESQGERERVCGAQASERGCCLAALSPSLEQRLLPARGHKEVRTEENGGRRKWHEILTVQLIDRENRAHLTAMSSQRLLA